MKILIRKDAAKLFANEVNRRIGRHGVWSEYERSFHTSLTKLQGKWLEVGTEHLFADQFNAKYPEGWVDEYADNRKHPVSGIRIYAYIVEQIEGDVRYEVLKDAWTGRIVRPVDEDIAKSKNYWEATRAPAYNRHFIMFIAHAPGAVVLREVVWDGRTLTPQH